MKSKQKSKQIYLCIMALDILILFWFKESIISFCIDAYSLIIKLLSNKTIILCIISIILPDVILLFESKLEKYEFCSKIDKFKINCYEKSSNDEIIKLIEDYIKNSGEENDNK